MPYQPAALVRTFPHELEARYERIEKNIKELRELKARVRERRASESSDD